MPESEARVVRGHRIVTEPVRSANPHEQGNVVRCLNCRSVWGSDRLFHQTDCPGSAANRDHPVFNIA